MTASTLSPFPAVLPAPSGALADPPFWCRTPLPKPADTTSAAGSKQTLPPWPVASSVGEPRLPVKSPVPCPVPPEPAAPPSPFFTPVAPVPPVPIEFTASGPAPHPVLVGKIPLMASLVEKPQASNTADFTDADLADALGPIIRQAVQATAQPKESNLGLQLEPLLRASIRRALAEYNPAARPFRQPGLWDRFFWRLLALFTSRTYEEIVFEKTHRFLVEEVYLLDRRSLALVSYASNDPARHSSPRRIEATVQRLARQVRTSDGGTAPTFELPERRTAITCQNDTVLLVAITRGTPNDLLMADLNFALQRIEERFHDRLTTTADPLLRELQPYLEDCLLIQSPAAA